MEIKKDILINFLRKVSINGNIDSLVLVFDEEGLKTKVQNPSYTIALAGLLKKEAFIKYECYKDGIGLKDVNKLLTILKNMDDEITIKLSDNFIIFKDKNRNFKSVLIDIEYIDSKIKSLPNIEFSGETIINSSIIKKCNNVCTTYNSDLIKISIKNKIISFTVSINKNDEYHEEIEFDYKDINDLNFSQPLLDLIQIFDDFIYLSLENNKPLQIKMKGNDYFIKYIIAPLTTGD